jgi:hypothetical protein
MSTRSELRKEAYQYILHILSRLPPSDTNKEWIDFIPLDELRQLKEGSSDPSPALVSIIKGLLNDMVHESVVDSYLVTPFEMDK